MNMMAVSWEDTTVLIDAGVMFPDPDQLGVDLIIPDFTYLESRRSQIKALVLTHGHEDHIGAVPHVMPLFDGPVYGTAMTLALVGRSRNTTSARARLSPMRPRRR
jgi:ribonuclease J